MHACGPSISEYDFCTVETLGLCDIETPPAFNSLTRLATRLFGVPVALISIVQEENDRQFFLSQQGLADPWKADRQTPLSHSFCQYVKRDGRSLVVNDARQHPLVMDNLAIRDLDVIAYLGVPVCLPNGTPLGALCVIDDQPRVWTEADIAALMDLASCVNDEILLRASLVSLENSRARARRYSAMRETIALAFMTPDATMDERFRQMLRAACDALKVSAGRLVKHDIAASETLFDYDPTGLFPSLESQIDLDALRRMVLSECAHVHFDDLSRPSPRLRHRHPAQAQGSYVGTPLIFNGILFGTIEFAGDGPRSIPWSEEELSILSIVSMFVTAHLGIFDQITVLQNSEKHLLRQLASQGKLA